MAKDNNLWKLVHGTKDHTAEFSADDIEKNKLMSILCYIWILWLVPLFAAKNSKYARFHVNQGIILSIVSTVIGIAMAILVNIPLIGWLFGIVSGIPGLVCLALAVLGIYNVIMGNAKELPFIGGYSIIK